MKFIQQIAPLALLFFVSIVDSGSGTRRAASDSEPSATQKRTVEKEPTNSTERIAAVKEILSFKESKLAELSQADEYIAGIEANAKDKKDPDLKEAERLRSSLKKAREDLKARNERRDQEEQQKRVVESRGKRKEVIAKLEENFLNKGWTSVSRSAVRTWKS